MAKDEPSAYDVLGIKSDVSDSDLQKAYRQRSLKVHPDRNPDLPDAAQKFHELTQAYELLRDPTRRSALDATLRLKEARKTRFAAYDSKRRALQEELEESERAFKKSRTAKAQQEQTEQQNLDLIQEQGRKLKKEMEEKRERGRTDGGGPITTAQGPPIGPLDSTVRLKYSNLDVPNLTSAAALSSFLQPFGSTDADSIVLSIKPRKKKSTGDGAIVTALVPFQSVRDAFAVVVSSKVGPLKRIESSWAGGEEPDIIRWLKREGKLTSGNAEPARLSGKSALLSDTPTFFPSFPDSIERASSSKNNHISSRPLDYESITLMRLRQAEREKLERDIRESEA